MLLSVYLVAAHFVGVCLIVLAMYLAAVILLLCSLPCHDVLCPVLCQGLLCCCVFCWGVLCCCVFCRGVRCPVGMYFVLCVMLGCILSSVCSVEVYFISCALSGFMFSCVFCRGVLCPVCSAGVYFVAVCSVGVYVLVYVTCCAYLKVNGVPSPCCGGKPCWADMPCCGVVTTLLRRRAMLWWRAYLVVLTYLTVTYLVMETCHMLETTGN